MDRGYYEKYYHLERNHWWFVKRSAIIESTLVNLLGQKKDLKILNIGIATGASSTMLEKFGKVTSSEFDKETCAFVRENLGIEVIEASITDLPFASETFDLVCAFDVIEHVENDQLAMQEMYRVCKTSGHVAITVPADMALWSEHDIINHHYRRYTKSQLLNVHKNAGFKVVFVSYFNSFLYPFIRVARWLKNKSGKSNKVTSDFDIQTPGWINHILGTIFSLEIFWLKHFTFPLGVSIILTGKKER